MTMKVTSVNNIVFNSRQVPVVGSTSPVTKNEINEIPNTNPYYAVTTPIKYTKIGEDTLSNGLKIHRYRLSNGYKVSIVPMEDSPAVVKSYVNVGALNETSDIKGISHFLEHMAFNGTNGEGGHIKLNTGDSFKKIDELGGWANASTNYAITDYVNSTPLLKGNDLETQIKVIAAMSEDLKLSDEMIEKEKGPVSSEINMILDDPKTIAMDQTVRTLFNINNPADELVGGSVKHIQNLTRKDVTDYYNKYYTPDNTNIVITGDVNPQKAIALVSKNFNSTKMSQGRKFEEKLFPIQKTKRKDFISDKAKSAEIIVAFAGPKNNNVRDKIIYDLAVTYMSSQKYGLNQNLKNYNAYPSIESEKISTNPNSARMVYIAASSSEDNCENVLKTITDTISNAEPIGDNDLSIIKEKILKTREDILEHSISVNNGIGNAVLDGNMDYLTRYNEILETITPDEVNDGIKRFFNLKKAAITVVHPDSKSKEISFKGNEKTKQPLNSNYISNHHLENNFEAGIYKTKSNNVNCLINLDVQKWYNKKPAAAIVLNEIYSMGMKGVPEAVFNRYKEENNLELYASSAQNGIGVKLDCADYKLPQNMDLALKLLYNPNITEENVEKAKQTIKDILSREQDSAMSLFNEYEAHKNPYEFSKKDILNSVDSITPDDVRECHDYLINNSRGLVSASVPIQDENNNAEKIILQKLAELPEVKPNKRELADLYKKQEKPTVLTKANTNSQADILQTYTFKNEDTVKESITGEIMNLILSTSSIGLFDNLREKENLAYSVHSEIAKTGNRGELYLNILTTTDNKNNNEVKYENLQKSINGFNRQISALKNGKFTEHDLQSAKLILKSRLLNTEGRQAKVSALDMGLCSNYGLEYINKLFNNIDSVTREDITKFADKVFAEKPVYSITATQDTLDSNKEFLDKLKES